MSSFLDVKNGIFDPSKRFAFTNITEDLFESKWDGQPINVRPGETVELPHHLAVKLTTELVDKIMIGAAKLDESKEGRPAYYRSPLGSNLGVPAARKPWEDKILRELDVDEESPEVQVMRAQIRSEVLKDLSREQSAEPVTIPSDLGKEFAEIKEGAPVEAPAPKKPLRVKRIKVV